jgi:DNA-binding beta-propeller fold protein YncE
MKAILAGCAGLALLISGCGSSSPNVITVTVSPGSARVIAGQVSNFTATVGGSTTLTVTWSCTYVYVPLPTTTTPNPPATKPAACTSGQTVNGGSIGTWTTSDANNSNVLTYTAPSLSSFPNPIPVITFTAAATADSKKTGKALVGLDSGIRVSISPSTATVPVGTDANKNPNKQPFSAAFQNVNAATAKYALVQPNTASTNVNDQTPNPLSETCDPTCGSIDSNGVYSAPTSTTLPTDTKPAGSKSTAATTVYVVGWSSSDTSQYAIATITLVSPAANSVSYKGLFPGTITAGGLLQDVFLDAKNLLNTTKIYFIPPTAAANLSSGQLTSQSLLNNASQVFTIPISTAYCAPNTTSTPKVACDASLVTRVRLLAPQLAQADPVFVPPQPEQPAWIVVQGLPTALTTSPNAAGCVNFPDAVISIACPIRLVNASPALVSALPDNILQYPTSSGTIPLGAIGGFYGASGNLVGMTYNGQSATKSTSSPSVSRQVFFDFVYKDLPAGPGLYEVAVASSTGSGKAPTFPTAISNIAIQPNFAIPPTPQAPIPLKPSGTITNLAPSAMALDSVKGFAVITEQATATLQFVALNANGPTQVGSPVPMGGTASAPTDIALDPGLDVTNNGSDLAVVVSSGDSSLYLYSITNTGTITPEAVVSVDLRTLLGQPTATGLPTPFAFGVDPSTHLGVVAYQNANIGFIVDINPNLDGSDKRACFLGGKAPCVVAPVSFTTGTWPKVVMQPNVPLAYVTPGGGTGVTSVVDLLQQGTTVSILPFSASGQSGAVRTAGITQIHTQTPHGINPILGGTVIISGIKSTKDTTHSFNGTFNIISGSVTDPYTFSYVNTGLDDVESNTSTALGSVTYGSPYYSFSTTTFVSGAAINPVTRTLGFADFNNNFSQIGFIDTLDQNLTSVSLTAGSCGPANGISCSPNPANAPEIGFRSVAFDPFTDVLIAYNPTSNSDKNFAGNEISLINPGGSLPGGSSTFPYRIIAGINTGQVGQGSYTPAGSTTPVTVYGPMVYDPKTKFVLVANAGSNSLTAMNLDTGHNFQPVHILDLRLADSTPSYGVPVAQPTLGSLAPAKTCTLTDPKQPCMPQAIRVGQPANLRILGQGFTSGTPVVRLDGKAAIIPPIPPGQTQPVSVTITNVTDSEIDITVPASLLFAPHDYALDVQSGGVTSNEIDLHVVGILDMSNACAPTSSFPQGPEGVAVDSIKHVALVTNYACNSVSVISIDPTGTVGPYGTVVGSVTVGKNPIGIAVIPRFGQGGMGTGSLAAVANSGETPTGTVSIIDYTTPSKPTIVTWQVTSGTTTTTASSVSVGLSPLGVTIDQDRALVLVANNGSNTLSAIDLTVLLASDPARTDGTVGHKQGPLTATTAALSGPPTALAVDPNRAVAVVTNLQNSGTTSVAGGLDVVVLSQNAPVKSSTASISSLSTSLTGLVYDPGDQNATNTSTTGVFYASSTQANAIYAFNPTTGTTQTIKVGINPYSLGFNYQTGTLLTINSTSNTASVVDSQNFKTRQTLGITSLSQFAIDVDNPTNTSVIVDQNNNRVVFLAMPK